MHVLVILGLAAGAAAFVQGSQPGSYHHKTRPLKKFTNLITFGDSYTDEDRLTYILNNNFTSPPPGTLLPPSNDTFGGGYTWDRWVADWTGATLYDYAVSGAVCSNAITPRGATGTDFSDILGYQLPAFWADVEYINSSTGTNTLYTDRDPSNTVYAIWIGTNDLGNKAFIDDSEVPGTNITGVTDCVFDVWDSIYQAGGRFFVLLNMAPLQLSPLYGLPDAGGVTAANYWPDKPANITEVSYKMMEYTQLVNRIWSLQIPFELLIAQRYPGASFALYDVNALITDIYNDPAAYLDSPANATGYYHHCSVDGSTCYNMNESVHSFLWYDTLHPGERTDQIIAENFIDVVWGNSSYGTYW